MQVKTFHMANYVSILAIVIILFENIISSYECCMNQFFTNTEYSVTFVCYCMPNVLMVGVIVSCLGFTIYVIPGKPGNTRLLVLKCNLYIYISN